jgi:hypothetical protein
MMVEHLRLAEQGLGEAQSAAGIAGQEHALGEGRGRVKVEGLGAHARER